MHCGSGRVNAWEMRCGVWVWAGGESEVAEVGGGVGHCLRWVEFCVFGLVGGWVSGFGLGCCCCCDDGC